VVVNGATGGDQGAGTVNAAGYYVNGVALSGASSSNGSFTGTTTGIAGTPTNTCYYSINGKTCTITLGTVTGTSNANSFTITGLPSACQPARNQYVPVSPLGFENNTVIAPAATNFDVLVTASSGTITFLSANSAAGWTASGTKGVANPVSFTYLLN
jgi:hypothetical protein